MKIGIDLGGTKIEIGAVDNDGRLVKALRLPTDVQGGFFAVVNQIAEGVMGLKIPFDALGVAVAGQVGEKGVSAPNLFWTEAPLAESLGKIVGKHVTVVNDVRASTFAEWRFGAGRGVDDLLAIFIGTGIGGGAVMGGRLVEGASHTALEAGHMVIDFEGPPCTCGNRGCFEAFCGGLGLSRRFGKGCDARQLIELMRAGDPAAQKIFYEAEAAYVAAFSSLVNLFNPKRLILGGGMVEGLPEIVELAKKGAAMALKAARDVEVVRSELAYPAVLGAALWKG